MDSEKVLELVIQSGFLYILPVNEDQPMLKAVSKPIMRSLGAVLGVAIASSYGELEDLYSMTADAFKVR